MAFPRLVNEGYKPLTKWDDGRVGVRCFGLTQLEIPAVRPLATAGVAEFLPNVTTS